MWERMKQIERCCRNCLFNDGRDEGRCNCCPTLSNFVHIDPEERTVEYKGD